MAICNLVNSFREICFINDKTRVFLYINVIITSELMNFAMEMNYQHNSVPLLKTMNAIINNEYNDNFLEYMFHA